MEGGLSSGGQEGGLSGEEGQAQCAEELGEFGVLKAGACECAEGYERDTHGCVAGMDTQCRISFGPGPSNPKASAHVRQVKARFWPWLSGENL